MLGGVAMTEVGAFMVTTGIGQANYCVAGAAGMAMIGAVLLAEDGALYILQSRRCRH